MKEKNGIKDREFGKKIHNKFILAILMGIVCGGTCALLDLAPYDNIWTFSSFSGSLGFWAITGMIVVMMYDTKIKTAIGTFLYFGSMNSTFFLVHFLISPLFEYPRIATMKEVVSQSLIWLIPSAICGLCAIIAHQAKKDNLLGIAALALPIGLLGFEAVSVCLSVIFNHKYLFQMLVDIFGCVLLWKLYVNEKDQKKLLLASSFVSVILLGITYLIEGTVLYY